MTSSPFDRIQYTRSMRGEFVENALEPRRLDFFSRLVSVPAHPTDSSGCKIMSDLKPLAELLQRHNFSTDGFENAMQSPEEKGANTEHAFDVIVENQRGIKLLGIPLFSGKSLLPLVDPPRYQRLDGVKVTLPHESMANYPLPGVDWSWSWSSWYVLMLHDVDEIGWVYAPFWRPGSCWHGKYSFGDFVRRRLWVRRRHRERADIIEV